MSEEATNLLPERTEFLPPSSPLTLTGTQGWGTSPERGKGSLGASGLPSTIHLAPTPASPLSPLWPQEYFSGQRTPSQCFYFWVCLLPLQVLTTSLKQDEQTRHQIKDLWGRAEKSWKQINLLLACQLRTHDRKGPFPLLLFNMLIRLPYHSSDTPELGSGAGAMKRLGGGAVRGGVLRTFALPSSKGCNGVQQKELFWAQTSHVQSTFLSGLPTARHTSGVRAKLREPQFPICTLRSI